MATAINAKRRAKAARAKSHRRRRPALIWAFAIAGAIAAVGALIAIQTIGGGGTTIPERIATGDGRILGNPDASITVIEYADFQCPVCKRAETSIISELERDYIQQGLVNVEYRMFPFLGQESWDAAQAAEAAREQGKFWEYHDALFNVQGRENSGAFSYDQLVEIAREIGLDVALFEETLSSNKYLEPIQSEVDAAREAGVNSTPTFFIGETKIVGARDYDEFVEVIDAELAAVEEAEQAP
jgi:protein-disulfide isomerase